MKYCDGHHFRQSWQTDQNSDGVYRITSSLTYMRLRTPIVKLGVMPPGREAYCITFDKSSPLIAV